MLRASLGLVFAAALQALESIESTSNASVGGCLVAKKSVERLTFRNDVTGSRRIPDPGCSSRAHEESRMNPMHRGIATIRAEKTR